MARGRLRTDLRFWLVAAGCLFVAFGFVDLIAGVAKGNNSLWASVARLVTGEYSCSTPDIVIAIVFRSALQAVPAAVIGWVLQAVAVVYQSRRGGSCGRRRGTRG